MESDSEFERRQEAEAAREGAHIGAEPGREPDEVPPGESSDPARRVVEEGGGGQAQGVELAEAAVIDRAETPRGPSPYADRERISEDDRAENEGGENDTVNTSEDGAALPDENVEPG